MMLTFRPITWADAAPLYVWRHDPETVKWSINPPPTWDEHLRWMNAVVFSPLLKDLIWIGLDDDHPIVCVSVSINFEVNINTNPLFRRFGFATQALRFVQGFEWPLKAVIFPDNTASIRLFEKCGFIKNGEIWEWTP